MSQPALIHYNPQSGEVYISTHTLIVDEKEKHFSKAQKLHVYFIEAGLTNEEALQLINSANSPEEVIRRRGGLPPSIV
jgi:hypothetical protein